MAAVVATTQVSLWLPVVSPDPIPLPGSRHALGCSFHAEIHLQKGRFFLCCPAHTDQGHLSQPKERLGCHELGSPFFRPHSSIYTKKIFFLLHPQTAPNWLMGWACSLSSKGPLGFSTRHPYCTDSHNGKRQCPCWPLAGERDPGTATKAAEDKGPNLSFSLCHC